MDWTWHHDIGEGIKYGVSGGPLNAAGLSVRAETQVRTLTRIAGVSSRTSPLSSRCILDRVREARRSLSRGSSSTITKRLQKQSHWETANHEQASTFQRLPGVCQSTGPR